MVGARVLLSAAGTKVKHLVLNVQARVGQSGGPVYNDDFSLVCAMIVGGYTPPGPQSVILAGVDPRTLHQTTHAVSAEYIQDML
jgi:hypothetical protein